MGILTTFHRSPLNNQDILDMYGFILAVGPAGTSTSFTVGIGPESWTVTGTGFGAYDLGWATTGTINTITFSIYGETICTVTDLSVSAGTMFNLLINGNFTAAAEHLFGQADTIIGSVEDDVLWGYAGNDNISGGAGNDVLHGSQGVNTISGGDGNDIIDSDTAGDTLNGGDGIDFVSLWRPSASGTYDISNWGSSSPTLLPDGTTIQNFERFEFLAISNPVTLTFTGALLNFSLTYYGGLATDRLVFDYSSGSGNIFTGIHHLSVNSNTIEVRNVEILQITGGSGNDQLTADGGDTLSGGAGNDALYSFGSGNTLNGGTGDDRFILWDLGSVVDGGDGIDTLASLSLESSGLNGVTLSTAGFATSTGVTIGTTTIRNVEGIGGVILTDGDDTFTVSATTVMTPGARVYGRGGFDTLILDRSLLTTNFQATLASEIGEDFERFIITTGSGNDIIVGTAGDDILSAGDGNDALSGSLGADQLNGGAGNDTAYYGEIGAVVVSLSNPALNTGDAAGDTFVSIENLSGGNFNDVLIGDAQNNVLREAVHGDDRLEGLGGNDTLDGGYYGNDILLGGDGDDDLTGFLGNDYLVGGAGADILRGGPDFDTASYEDATAGVTVHLPSVFPNVPGPGAGDAAGDVFISIEGLVGSAFADTLVGDDYDNAIEGGAGDDTLTGGVGNDRLLGGDGNDTIYYDPADDLAYVQGGDGVDLLVYTAGGPPVGVDLGAHGFERAEGRLTDSGGAVWATQTINFDNLWRADFATIVNDNGSRAELDYDQASAFNWTTNFNEYDALNRLDVNVTVYDTGFTAAFDYDQASAFNWISNWNQYAPGNVLDINVTTYDDGVVASNDFDEGNAFAWTTNFNQYDALSQLDINVTVFDSGITAAYDFDQTNAFNWISNYNEYAVGGALDLNVTIYDDASYAVNEYDELAEFDWTTNWESYDTLGRLDQNVVEYDNGNTAVVDYDQADQFTWASIWQLFDAGGNLIGYQGVNDDGSLFGGP